MFASMQMGKCFVDRHVVVGDVLGAGTTDWDRGDIDTLYLYYKLQSTPKYGKQPGK